VGNETFVYFFTLFFPHANINEHKEEIDFQETGLWQINHPTLLVFFFAK
jgi:hypothetical protein